jgi:hypothetical protein
MFSLQEVFDWTNEASRLSEIKFAATEYDRITASVSFAILSSKVFFG